MAATPPLRADEVVRILSVLVPLTTDRSVVLVGGQAVAFWARFLGVEAGGAEGQLLASKDVDFEGGGDAARTAARLLGGTLRLPTMDDHTPNAAVVLFQDSDGVPRRIDFLVAPIGLDASDVRRTAVALELGAGDSPVSIAVMHPERVMESRICNVQILGIDDDHAIIAGVDRHRSRVVAVSAGR